MRGDAISQSIPVPFLREKFTQLFSKARKISDKVTEANTTPVKGHISPFMGLISHGHATLTLTMM